MKKVRQEGWHFSSFIRHTLSKSCINRVLIGNYSSPIKTGISFVGDVFIKSNNIIGMLLL